MFLKLKSVILVLIFFSILSYGLYAEDIYIIYTANINGMIENCGCGVNPLGGIGRVKSLIDRFRKEYKRVVVIDGGDYFNSYPFQRLNDSMLASLELLNYDCLVPGDQAFVEGEPFFSNYNSKYRDKIIISNSKSDFQKHITKKFDQDQIEVYGYMSPYIFDFIAKPERIELVNFVNAKPKPQKENSLLIAVVHGYLSNAEQFAVENSSVSLILLAHDQRKGIWEKNQATIVGNGKDSEYVSVIRVNSLKEWKIDVEQIKIHEDLPEDEQIVKIIEDYKRN
jgi:2',3'-cyclic-nucleotide 2'-phosphodiesterase (5'-nucleotidase family)